MGDATLPGPRSPPWKCRCGFERNFLNRTKCYKCQADPPRRIQKIQQANAKVPGATSASGRKPEQAGGDTAIGKQTAAQKKIIEALTARLSKLESQNQKCPAAPPPSGPPAPLALDDSPNPKDEAISHLEMAIAAIDSTTPLAKELQTQLELRRRERAEALPPEKRVVGLQRKFERAQEETKKLLEAKEAAATAFAEADEAHTEAAAEASRLEAQLAELHATLASQQEGQVEGAADEALVRVVSAALPGGDSAARSSLFDQLRGVLGEALAAQAPAAQGRQPMQTDTGFQATDFQKAVGELDPANLDSESAAFLLTIAGKEKLMGALAHQLHRNTAANAFRSGSRRERADHSRSPPPRRQA